MDGRALATLRYCLMGSAAAGLLSPGEIDAQIFRPTAKTVSTSAKPAVQLRPTAGAVRQAAYQPVSGEIQVAESGIQQRLRELYERDGREAPSMNLSPTQTPPPAPPRQVPTTQPQHQTPPRVTQTAARPSENRFTSFFKKLVPGGNRRAKSQSPAPAPRPLTTPSYSQPVIQPAPAIGTANAAPPATNPSQTAAPRIAPTQPATTAASPRPLIPPSPPVEIEETLTFEPPIQRTPAAESETESDEFFESSEESPRIPAIPAESKLDAALDEELSAAPELPIDPAPPEEIADEFSTPFGAESTDEPALESQTPEASPFTGKTLEIEEPVSIPIEPAPVPAVELIDPPKPVAEEDSAEQSNAAKMRRIVQRSDLRGLKGFCPVTLRDQRELADSRPEFSSTHRGQKFFFASKFAQKKFEQDPARYAPVAFGSDVVVLMDGEDVVEGTLDFAAWFKGRLYLFGSQETHDKFVNAPDQYATPRGIE